MGSRKATPGELTPVGMMCRGRRGAWTDAKSIARIIIMQTSRFLRGHLRVDPVSSASQLIHVCTDYCMIYIRILGQKDYSVA